MGRFFSGDIEGKFWFAVQSSNAGERFGATEQEPDHIKYYADDIDLVKNELKVIETNLGEYLPKLDEFFKEHYSYNDEQLIKHGFPADKIKFFLKEYADYGLGIKIRDCIEDNGGCAFEAEI
jgi:hypothetical protein